MKLKTERSQSVTQNDEVLATKALYYRYSSWLLGYLLEVVKDHAMAERYLVEIFKEVPDRLEDFNGSDKHPWITLKLIAKSKLAGHFNGLRLKDMANDLNTRGDRLKFDNFVSAMNMRQQIVFCGVYYYQKSTAVLASELGMKDLEIKKILKEAFVMIKNG